MALSTARMAVALDSGLSGVTHVWWSENGSSETAKVAKTSVTLKSATVANPSVKSNNGALSSAQASSSGTISHFGFGTSSTLYTSWVQLTNSVVLAQNGTISVADGALAERLTQA